MTIAIDVMKNGDDGRHFDSGWLDGLICPAPAPKYWEAAGTNGYDEQQLLTNRGHPLPPIFLVGIF